MKDQIHAPVGEGSDKTEEQGNAPKKLAKPNMPKGLEKPRAPERKLVGFRCGCGATHPKYGGCQRIPIYDDEGWSGPGHHYDGNRPIDSITSEEYKGYRENPDPSWPKRYE